MLKSFTPILLLSFFSLTSCITPMMKGERSAEWNRMLLNRDFIVQKDLGQDPTSGPNGERSFKKGDRVGIWTESSIDWLKVKAYPARENREQALGQTIIYLFRTDLPQEEQLALDEDETYGETLLLQEIEKILTPADGESLKIPEVIGR